jgi:hypothetical protein
MASRGEKAGLGLLRADPYCLLEPENEAGDEIRSRLIPRSRWRTSQARSDRRALADRRDDWCRRTARSPKDVAEAIFADPDTILANSTRPSGRRTVAEGGYG